MGKIDALGQQRRQACIGIRDFKLKMFIGAAYHRIIRWVQLGGLVLGQSDGNPFAMGLDEILWRSLGDDPATMELQVETVKYFKEIEEVAQNKLPSR